MKTQRKVYILLSLAISTLWLFQACKKEENKNNPSVSTLDVSSITTSSAISGANVSSNGGGTISATGICWSAGRIPTIDDHTLILGKGTGEFSGEITDLVNNTTYFVRAYAKNEAGVGYGQALQFSTLQGNGTVSDVDGNVYDTIVIGTQVWLAQNLKVTHYNNGEAIDSLDDNTQWCNTITGAFCDFDNDPDNTPIYGHLYNSYAVTDARGLAPTGWHIATQNDWETLIAYLGGEEVAGGYIKEEGTDHWTTPNTGAGNSSGFTAVPGGYRFGRYGIPGYGQFINLGKYAYWWNGTGDQSIELGYKAASILLNDDIRLTDGFSVRCVKN